MRLHRRGRLDQLTAPRRVTVAPDRRRRASDGVRGSDLVCDLPPPARSAAPGRRPDHWISERWM